MDSESIFEAVDRILECELPRAKPAYAELYETTRKDFAYPNGLGYLAFIHSMTPFNERRLAEQHCIVRHYVSGIVAGRHINPFRVAFEEHMDPEIAASVRGRISEACASAVENAATTVKDLDDVLRSSIAGGPPLKGCHPWFTPNAPIFRDEPALEPYLGYHASGLVSLLAYEFDRIKGAVQQLAGSGLPVDMIVKCIIYA